MKPEAIAFALSIAINAAILGSFDQATRSYETTLEAEKEKAAALEELGKVQFEYIESPEKTSPRPVENAKKMSDRDSVAQDRTLNKEEIRESSGPNIATEGPADQLAQQRSDPSQRPSPASKPAPYKEEQAPVEATADKAPAKSAEIGEDEASTIQEQAPLAEPKPAQEASLPAPAAKEVPPKEVVSGNDRITTQAISKTRSHGAQIYGVEAYEAMGSDMGKYMKNLKERIWLSWFPYLVFHYPKDFKSAEALLQFTLDRSGEVKSVKVLKSEGSDLFSSFCMDSVQRASPFGPVPSEILDLMGRDDLDITFSFHYW